MARVWRDMQAVSGMTPAVSAILRGLERGIRWPLIRCSRRCLRPTVAILEASASRRGLVDGPRSGYLAGLRYLWPAVRDVRYVSWLLPLPLPTLEVLTASSVTSPSED